MTGELYPGNLSLTYFYVQDTREDNNGLPVVVVVDSYLRIYISMFSPDVCHQLLLQIVHREELKVNWILSAKVEFSNSEKGRRDRYKLLGTRHFTPFKMDAKKWRENRESLVSNLESRWSVLVEGRPRALKMLPKVVRHFVTSRFETLLKSISFQM